MSRHNENIPRLADEELRAIRESLLRDASNREAYAPEGNLTVVIDGEPYDSLDPNTMRGVRCAVGDKARWIEVHDRKSVGGMLLAAHLYRQDEVPSKGRRKYVTTLEGGQRITFIAYKKDGQPFVEILYRETSLSKALPFHWRLLKNELKERLVVTPSAGLTARRATYSLALLCLFGSLAILIPYLRNSPVPTTAHIDGASTRPGHDADIIPMPPSATPEHPLPAGSSPTSTTAGGRSNSPSKKPYPKRSKSKPAPQLARYPNAKSPLALLSQRKAASRQYRAARFALYALRLSSSIKDVRRGKIEVTLAEREIQNTLPYKYHKLPYSTRDFEQE
jgi:hypothetical protein